MNFQSELAAWDGKTVATLEAIFARAGSDPQFPDLQFVDALIDYLSQPVLQKGASWLLKKRAESGDAFSAEQVDAIYALLPQLEAWETKLHILQSIPALPISVAQREGVEDFLRSALLDKNKFVRAWAYNGFYELARQYPEFREEAGALFERSLHEEAASVRARVRNIMKKGFDK